MADAELKAIIKIVTDEAEKSIDRITTRLAGLSDDTEASSQKQTQSWSRVNSAIKGISVIASGLFAGMIANSPDLASALTEISFLFQEVFDVLGTALAPLIESFIPILENLTTKFIALDPSIHKVIATTIALISTGGGLVTLLGKVGLSIGGLSNPIGLAITAIVGLALAWKTNFADIRGITKDTFNTLKGIFNDFNDDYGGVIQNLISGIQDLWTNIEPVVSAIANLFLNVFSVAITTAVERVMTVVGEMARVFSGVIDVVNGILTLNFPQIAQGLEGIFKGVLNILITAFNALFIDPLNIVLEGIKGWKILPQGIKDAIPTLPTIPTFHGGGIIGGSGEQLLLGLSGEEVITENDPRHINNVNSNGFGGNITIVVQLQNLQVRNYSDLEMVKNSAQQGAREGIGILGTQRYVRSGYVG